MFPGETRIHTCWWNYTSILTIFASWRRNSKQRYSTKREQKVINRRTQPKQISWNSLHSHQKTYLPSIYAAQLATKDAPSKIKFYICIPCEWIAIYVPYRTRKTNRRANDTAILPEKRRQQETMYPMSRPIGLITCTTFPLSFRRKKIHVQTLHHSLLQTGNERTDAGSNAVCWAPNVVLSSCRSIPPLMERMPAPESD